MIACQMNTDSEPQPIFEVRTIITERHVKCQDNPVCNKDEPRGSAFLDDKTKLNYRETSNIRPTWIGNKIVDH